MSLLGGVAAASGAVGALGALNNTLFPKQILIKIPDQKIEVNIDSATNISVNTSVTVSDHPTEDKEVLAQNVSPAPRTITLSCMFSNIIRLSNINTVSAAAQFGIAAAIPEAAGLSDILLNEEDSIVTRLGQLRTAQKNGQIVTIIGLPEQNAFEFIIVDVSDDESTETGTKSRSITLTIQEARIAKKDPGISEKGLFSTIIDLIPANL